MNDRQDYYGDVRRARAEDGQLLLRLFTMTFDGLGWLVSGHGSVFVTGDGRDVDFVFNRASAEAITREEVIERLTMIGVQPIDAPEYRTSRAFGLIGTFGGLAVDFTFFEAPPSGG